MDHFIFSYPLLPAKKFIGSLSPAISIRYY